MKLLMATFAPLILTALAQIAPPSQGRPDEGPGAQPATTQTALTAPASRSAPRFTTIDITIDSSNEPLAAYQFELTAAGADVKIVGVEGGEHPAYREPPYYDPAALSHDRIIIAAFNTGHNLPTGKTRVARLHLQVTGGEPEYRTKLDVAGSAQGESISARISVQEGEGQ